MTTPPGWTPPAGGQYPPAAPPPFRAGHQQPVYPPGPYPLEPWQAYPQYQVYPYLPPAPPAGPGVNAYALASVVTAGMGLVTVFLAPITSILAVVFGHKALGQVKRTGETGRTMAVVGLWIGYVTLALIVLGVVVVVIAVAAT